jgi:hypothetical protein
VRSLIKNVPDPLPEIYTMEMYPIVMDVLLNSDESGLLQNGEEFLRILVHRNFRGILQWSDGQKNGLELLLQFIAKMLAPNQTESGAIFIGNLVRKLISKV